MNSYLQVQYEQQRHRKSSSYWSSLPRGFGELNPNPHFWILLPCQWVPVLAASHLIPLRSKYLFRNEWQKWIRLWWTTLLREQKPYIMVVCMIDWSTVLPIFQGSFPKYTQAYLSTIVFLLKNIFHHSIIQIQK